MAGRVVFFSYIKIAFDLLLGVFFVVRKTIVRFMYCILQLDVYHPALFRCYIRKNDMDEPPPLEDGSSYGQKDFHKDKHKKTSDGENLEDKFYKYGVRPEWLQIHRVISHRYVNIKFY